MPDICAGELADVAAGDGETAVRGAGGPQEQGRGFAARGRGLETQVRLKIRVFRYGGGRCLEIHVPLSVFEPRGRSLAA